MVVDTETILDDVLKIDAPPAHHAINRGVGPGFDDCSEFGLLFRREPRFWAAGPSVQKPVRAGFVEAMNPASRKVRRSMPPIRAASVRVMPSRTAASDSKRRL